MTGEDSPRDFTERHYRTAVEQLEDIDAVIDVASYDAWQSGEIFVHTNYVTTGIISDVIDRFNLRIIEAHVERPSEHSFDCVHEHGRCFEIGLDFYHNVWELEDSERFYEHLESSHKNTDYGLWVDNADRLFNAEHMYE